jgi:hypothetical protein
VLQAGLKRGIPWREIAQRVEHSVENDACFYAPRLARVLFFERCFEFADAVGEPQDGDGAMIFVALGEGGVELDLAAWAPPRPPATWLGRAALLGAENLYRYQPFDTPILVHFEVEAYLRHACRGVLVLDEQRAAETLRRCPRLAVEDVADLRRLEPLLRPHLPEVAVREDRRRG